MVVEFASALVASNSAQDIVSKWLESRGFVVEDLRNDMEAQKNGIDLRFIKNNRSYTGEIKLDSYISKTGNFALEIVSNLSKGTLGCWVSSKADFWFYVDAVNNIVHIFKPNEVKGVVSSSERVKWNCSLSSTRGGHGETAYRTISLLVPFETVSATHSYRKHLLSGEETF